MQLQPVKHYTGIGSRNTPVWCRFAMEDIASALALKGYILRSGAAQGADSAFEIGCDRSCGSGEIYIPWKSFGCSEPTIFKDYITLSSKEFQKARRAFIKYNIIPHFDSMKSAIQKLHARNYYQVLGKQGKKSLVCIYYANVDWCTGEPEGGTRSAVMLSKLLKIPCYNLQDQKDFDKVASIVKIPSMEHYKLHQDVRLGFNKD